MKNSLAALTLTIGLSVLIADSLVATAAPLQKIEINSSSVGIDEQLWSSVEKPGDLQALLQAIDHSLSYLNTPAAVKAYQNYSVAEFSVDRVRRSLTRFRQLLLTAKSPYELQQAVMAEFNFYQSVGNDNQGTVAFTGYFEPVYQASAVPTEEYRYPLYRKPTNFSNWSQPHPSRLQLEGKDGLLGNKSILAGSEIVWLRDRMEAFLVQVQGSAKLKLTDGRTITVGYDGSTDYPYKSLGGELVKEGIFTLEELTLPKLIDYFKTHPEALDKYIPRNNRFIFFRETNGQLPTGSLNVPVTGDRSIATDKSIMPPGALGLIVAPIPYPNQNGSLTIQNVNRYVLDQDTGSAIKGAGRVDIFLGSGQQAGDRAGLLNGTGKLYYLLLK
ncbi:MltA domain protein [Stanieria cyanosphaera PCC 7437]|uniref:peptidoglycan lytic exotransglycosylase n=1 Tax=Stanieria cyanosphaera (strain ATCC 29371 / PCC 7437) TaxID=111780 RepID=K9XWL6_STAC7|nr:murein transglycosylase A [Stanieria cyanosphaera]AFZ36923.1 MltA domain protein [Stanieria cyanosphaera PCC 7437]